ncbi:hypothetical protein N2152v2_009762 [Parachlorella kessleri]
MNHNVKLSLVFSLFENFSSSVRSGDIMSAYLYLITKDNSVVGYTQGLNGIAQLVAALPAGVLTDRHRRDTMLRVSALVGLLAGCLMAYTLLLNPGLRHLCVAMAALGVYRGVYNPPLESIFADSVRAGRSSLYTKKYIITILASGCGPLLSLVLFWRLGNQWEASDCRHVLLWGLGLMVVPLVVMCCFDDSKALEHHHSANCEASRAAVPPGLAVTLLIFTSDLIGAFASGMTLKFFAMFFMQVCHVSPAVVSLLGLLGPLCTSTASWAAQRTSRMAGRVQTSLVTRAADVMLLTSMAYLPTTSRKARLVLMSVHLLRMALANCTRPLMRSVLMDAVPRHHRGKVNAVDSVRMFSWSGSAAVGGVLVEKYGFQSTFLITAFLKLFAFIPLLFLVRYVPDGWLAGAKVGTAAQGAGYSLLPASAAPERLPLEGSVIAAADGACGQGDGSCSPGGVLEPLLNDLAQMLNLKGMDRRQLSQNLGQLANLASMVSKLPSWMKNGMMQSTQSWLQKSLQQMDAAVTGMPLVSSAYKFSMARLPGVVGNATLPGVQLGNVTVSPWAFTMSQLSTMVDSVKANGGPDVIYPSLDAFLAATLKGSLNLGMDWLGKPPNPAASATASSSASAGVAAAAAGAGGSSVAQGSNLAGQTVAAAGVTAVGQLPPQGGLQYPGMQQWQQAWQSSQGMAQLLTQEQAQAVSGVFRDGI